MILKLNTTARANTVFAAQKRYIQKHCDALAAKQANYGWGQGASHMETKVYGHFILVSQLEKRGKSTTVTHATRAYLLANW
jgi:hypothetical protein